MTTKESQYNVCLELRDRIGLAKFGLMSNYAWYEDPKRLVFQLSRYKFVAKMLSGCERVLEVGCADAFATRIVQQNVGRVTAIDFDPEFIQDAKARMDPKWELDLRVHNILEKPVVDSFDGVFALDVLEHIPADQEHRFLENVAVSLEQTGVFIVGIPSLQSQKYASPESRAGHVNCKDGPQLKELLSSYFHNVFVFSMNDEVVHTGFHLMAQYLLALCCGRKEKTAKK